MRVQRGDIEKPLQISTLSFDGDMTLWDFRKVMRNSLQQTLTELQKQVPTPCASKLTVDEMIEIRNRLAEEVKGEVWSLLEIRRRAFKRTLEHVGHPDKDLAAHLNAVYRKHRYADIELYPDVIPTFDALAPHFQLGLLSNGNTYPESCGLDGRFAFVVFSQDVQVEKPDPKIFQITAERAGCDLTEILHVGDSLKNDVMGAKNVGAQSVWLNRDGLPNDTDIRPDYEIASLTEIPEIIRIRRNNKTCQ